MPRITREAADGPASYFGDVLAYKDNRRGLKKALELGSKYGDRTVEQLEVLSDIVSKEVRRHPRGHVLFASGGALCLGAVIFG